MRSTIIFGNGLGMALNPNYFALSAALKHVWNNSTGLKDEQRKLIKSALPTNDTDHPQSEEVLNDLQMAIFAAEFLIGFEQPGTSWLDENAREIPEAFKKFIHEVGLYFHNSSEILPPDFTSSLSNYISTTSSHVAVLNYDNLLYDALIHSKILDNYDGVLFDGFLSKFSVKQLERYYPHRQGWFMHLHGSPLFIDDRKMSSTARDFLLPNHKCHIVLTHINFKTFLIDESPILSEYWIHLNAALAESNKVILFGYSGQDIHLNNKLIEYAKEKEINVVEWSGIGTKTERINFWKQMLNSSKIKLLQLDSILEFREW